MAEISITKRNGKTKTVKYGVTAERGHFAGWVSVSGGKRRVIVKANSNTRAWYRVEKEAERIALR